MVATGTDVKPLEVVLFMKDVRSDVLYTQMKGRGCRVISDDKEKFVEYTKDAKPLKEMDTDFMLKTLDHIKVFEDGTLLVVFLDGSEIECRSEEA